ncbi:MAG TPA: hypothetical protein PK605_09180 [Ignavibacteria bacterium]|nr:hypothetical protein [Bacteroidota bacterium]HRE12009.1 hypothetical protein [Ignavibacteria bacterium]HRF65440.1 hypothetical protein [Ignavibacteria bacterium]HRJ04559.1 hypothetical protein [Ignavibacteria bacterium]HRJ85334.1 hypothetical protein [Ignavibacteria bacterium]
MTQLEIKTNFHKLIDEIEDQNELTKLYEYCIALKQNFEKSGSDWWGELSEEQKRNFDIAIEQCNDPSKQISHEEVMRESKKWLKK